MRYISEERLRELFDQYKAVAELNCNQPHFDGMLDMLEMVIDECKELNPLSDPEFKEYVVNEEALAHDAGYAEGYNRGFEDGKRFSGWQPIDEDTPKDRSILLIYFHYEKYIAVTGYWDGKYYETDIDCLYGETPIFWQELPELPEPPK